MVICRGIYRLTQGQNVLVYELFTGKKYVSVFWFVTIDGWIFVNCIVRNHLDGYLSAKADMLSMGMVLVMPSVAIVRMSTHVENDMKIMTCSLFVTNPKCSFMKSW